ncbi:unnamed protein product [Boreogadus saida]
MGQPAHRPHIFFGHFGRAQRLLLRFSASGVLDGDLVISAGMVKSENMPDFGSSGPQFQSDLQPRTASPPPLLSLRSAGRRSQLGVGEKERCRSSKANSGCTSLLGPKAV